jgi:Protein of unknown function (DUF2605)
VLLKLEGELANFQMYPTDLPDPDLLKTLFEPLLEDFLYWLGRTKSLLLEEEIDFLGTEAQADLLGRVEQALQEIQATQSLFRATDGQAGVDSTVVMNWHKLVAECWQVSVQFRTANSNPASSS